MTEHIERRGDQILFDGAPLHDRHYIGNGIGRFFGLVEQSQFAFGFFTLGPLPELTTFRDIFLQHALYRLPFPPMPPPRPTAGHAAAGRRPARSGADYDCIFTGATTPTASSPARGSQPPLPACSSCRRFPRRSAQRLDGRALVALNIPQDAAWSGSRRCG